MRDLGSRQNWWKPWLRSSLPKTLQSLNSVTKSSVIGAWTFCVQSIDLFGRRRSRLTLMSLGFLGFGCTMICEHQVIVSWSGAFAMMSFTINSSILSWSGSMRWYGTRLLGDRYGVFFHRQMNLYLLTISCCLANSVKKILVLI